ncbi:FMN-binding negative transcriptional regulator, partial [Streptomyces sp. NPDC005236]|uniref:FMN-binding negative transcriptional regulator n=1 Tax=Streptomyces sp. NPDC005236 TaxID=3157028 RepID=UPI0033B52B18
MRWQLSAQDPPRTSAESPALANHAPTHETRPAPGSGLLIHLARPNPVWEAIEADPAVTFTVTGD